MQRFGVVGATACSVVLCCVAYDPLGWRSVSGGAVSGALVDAVTCVAWTVVLGIAASAARALHPELRNVDRASGERLAQLMKALALALVSGAVVSRVVRHSLPARDATIVGGYSLVVLSAFIVAVLAVLNVTGLVVAGRAHALLTVGSASVRAAIRSSLASSAPAPARHQARAAPPALHRHPSIEQDTKIRTRGVVLRLLIMDAGLLLVAALQLRGGLRQVATPEAAAPPPAAMTAAQVVSAYPLTLLLQPLGVAAQLALYWRDSAVERDRRTRQSASYFGLELPSAAALGTALLAAQPPACAPTLGRLDSDLDSEDGWPNDDGYD